MKLSGSGIDEVRYNLLFFVRLFSFRIRSFVLLCLIRWG